jgi:hypothetical protein
MTNYYFGSIYHTHTRLLIQPQRQPIYNHTHIKMSAPVTNAAAAQTTSKFQSFMNHPAGPKYVPSLPRQTIESRLTPRTIFFWAPLAKWGLVAAGLKDFSRPAEKLSVSQNVALAATGFIWVWLFSIQYEYRG